jgi:hypothetical protein
MTPYFFNGVTNGTFPFVTLWLRLEHNYVIRRIKEDGLLIRQLARATGITQGIIAKRLTKKKRPFCFYLLFLIAIIDPQDNKS